VSELYATDEVLKRLSAGASFRDVYREVGMDLGSVATYDPDETIRNRTSEGTTGNLGLGVVQETCKQVELECEGMLASLESTYTTLTGMELQLVRW
jgi:hypothetical protein